MGTVSVITSGKGGVGKSSMTIGLGSALARLGKSVLLVDGDAGLSSLDIMLGITDAAVYNLADIFEGRSTPIKAIYSTPYYENLHVITAPERLEDMCSPTDMRRLCRGFAKHFDHVIIDCPAGIGEGFCCAVAGASRAFIVTTPDIIGARAAKIVSDVLAEKNIPSRLLINRLKIGNVLNGKSPNIDELIDTVCSQLIGIVPEDEMMSVSLSNGHKLPENSNAFLCFDNIAKRVLQRQVPLTKL